MKRWYWIAIILVLLAIIIVLPPLIYHYVYPNVSDDSSEHLKVFDKIVVNPFGTEVIYLGQWIVGFLIGLTGHIDVIFLWFSFIVLLAIGIMIFFITSKMINIQAGLLAIPLVMFCTTAIISLFEHGILFNLINMYLVLPVAVILMVYWISAQKNIYLISSMIAFGLFSIFHTSGLYLTYIIIPFGLLLTGILIWKKRKKLATRVIVYCFGLAIMNQLLTIYATPKAVKRVAGATTSNLLNNTVYSGVLPPTIFEFFNSYLSSMTTLFLIVSVGFLIVYRKRAWSILSEKGKIFLLFLLVTIAALGFASFTKYTFDPTRIAFDLAVTLAIFTACTSGLALVILLEMIKEVKKKRLIIGTVITGLLIGSIPVLTLWFSYSNAVKPVDLKAIEYVNSLNGNTYSKSSQVQELIYNRFINKKYVEIGGDYTIYRSEAMTPRTSILNLTMWGLSISNFNDFTYGNGYKEIKRFEDNSGVIIVIFTRKY